jgi:hypothetical protein
MQRFLSEKIICLLRWITTGILFLAFYFYFFSFNKFHLFYLEQTQLFRFSVEYFKPFIEKPGEFVFYLGEFLSQFFVNPFISAGISSLLTAITCFLTHLIFKKIGINTFVWSFIPALFIAALQSDHQYKVGLTVGVILALLFGYLYLLIKNSTFRFFAGSAGWILLYHLSGGFALLASVLMVLFELFYFKSRTYWVGILIFVFIAVCVPYFGWKFIYLINFRDAWLYPFPFWGVSRILLFAAFLAYFPVVILILAGYKKIRKKEILVVQWNYKTILAGSIILVSGVVLIEKYAYDPKTEILLGLDHNVQTENWDKVIDLSKSYPGTNKLILYYTNLALYKTGQLSERMFSFPQHGIDGLRLEWKRNEVAPFFGGEIFYQLNYFNEAYRWAFESMVAKGVNPRSLKRLVLTSLINGHYQIAGKYLNLLDQSMFYKNWATKYRTYITDTTKIQQDQELANKRKFIVKHDFISDALDYNLGLKELLLEHPDNRMAFEYQMAVFLLNKDITNFAANIYRLKELGYRTIPVNYEEALLFCMVYLKKNLVPQGYSIRPETVQREKDYIAQLSGFGGNRALAASELYNQFGKTYWYYLHFTEQTDKK